MKTHYTNATRFLCLILCFVMLLGLLPPMSVLAEEEDAAPEAQVTPVETTPEEVAETQAPAGETFSLEAPTVNADENVPPVSHVWSQQELASGYAAVPEVMVNNAAFMNAYVNNSNTLNLHTSFVRTASPNTDGATYNLPKGVIEWDDHDEQWYASYKWDPTQAERDALARDNTTLYFKSNMIPYYKKHFYLFFFDKHWCYPGIRIVRANNDGSNSWTYHQNDYGGRRNGDVIDHWIAKQENSGSPQPVEATWEDYPAGNKAMYINFYTSWNTNHGESKINGTRMYMVAGSEASLAHATISGDSVQPLERDTTGTLTLWFDGAVRFADNAAHDGLTVKLAAEYLDQSQYTGGFEIKATMSKMGVDENGNSYIQFTFPVEKKHQHFKITRVLAKDNGLMPVSGKELNLKVFDKEGKPLNSYGAKSSTMLTDRHGNPVQIGELSVDVTYDGVHPTLTKVDMSGKDISANSTKAPTNWNENSGNNRFVYAGIGDKITFKAYFSETIDAIANLGDVRAVLNIKDGNDNPVELAVEKEFNNGIEFKPLVITEKMTPAGEKIMITGFKNLTVTDFAGNVCSTDLTKNIRKPDQQISLDVDRPEVTSSYEMKDDGFYESAYHGNKYFSFPVTFSDFDNNGAANSGISGKDVSFSLDMPSGKAYSYRWNMNTSQTVAADATWNYGTTGKPNTFKDVSGDLQYWVHIQLSDNVNYDFAMENGTIDDQGVYFIGALNFTSATDWAGNAAGGKVEYPVKLQIDEQGPTGAMTAAISVTPDYDNATVKFDTSFLVSDDFGIEKVMYQWHVKEGDAADYKAYGYKTLTEAEMGSGVVSEVRYSPYLEYNYSENRVGSVKLEVWVEDLAGNDTYIFWSDPASFDYTKPSSNSSVTVNDPANPVAVPEIIMKAPKYKEGAGFAFPPRTMVLIPLPESVDENGNYTQFYAWDAWDWALHENVYAEKPFQEMLDALAALESPAPKVMYNDLPGSFYKLTGTVDAQNHSGTFTDILPYCRSGELSQIRNFFDTYYGRMDIYLVTSSSLAEFIKNSAEQNLEVPEENSSGFLPDDPSKFNFTGNESIVDTYTVYLANNPTYEVVTRQVVNAEGLTDAQSERPLNYASGKLPATSLDNVAITIQVTNESDKTAVHGQGYGLQFLNFSEGNGAIKLYYQGADKYVFDGDMSAYTPIYTWDLVLTGDGTQTVVIEPGICTENGWYIITVELEDTNLNTTYTFNLSEQGEDPMTGEKFDYYCQFFMDTTTLDITATTVEKRFADKQVTTFRDTYEWFAKDIQATYEETGEAITIGMAPLPEGWEMEYNAIHFVADGRPEGDPAKDYSGYAYTRIYNETYNSTLELETNPAVWDEFYANGGVTRSLVYYLADPENPEENPYGDSDKLPLLPGRNLIVYEVKAPNGHVATREIVIDVVTEAEDWSLAYVLLPNEELPTSAEVWPVDAYGAAMAPELMNITTPREWNEDGCMPYDQTKYNFYRLKSYRGQSGSVYNDDFFTDSYTCEDNVVDHEYAMIDPLGNVSVRTLSILKADGTPVLIDSRAPHYVGVDGYCSSYPNYVFNDYYESGSTFMLRIYAYDHQSWIDPRNMTLTFDPEYSLLLNGMNGTMDENGRLTMQIPLALDENGEVLMNEDGTYAEWTSKDTNHNGIFYTRLVQVGPTDADIEEYGFVGYVELQIMGAWKYDPNADESSMERELTIGVSDEYGNIQTGSITWGYDNEELAGYRLVAYENGQINYDSLTSTGVVGVAFNSPFASVSGYGAKNETLLIDEWEGRRKFYYTAPMITQDSPVIGEDEEGKEIYDPYIFTVTDLFGQSYEIPVGVYNMFGKLGIEVSFSEINPTNQPVTVYANSTGNIEKITSIAASDGTVGTIDPLDPTKASITVTDNCVVTITTDGGSERKVSVMNIDKVVDPVYVRFYNEYYDELKSNMSASKAYAVLCCDTEYVTVTNGSQEYAFPAGSTAGTTYTFEYCDEAGNTGTYTATLPITLSVPEGGVDEVAPDVTASLYMQMGSSIQFMDQFENPGFDETAQQSEITAQLNDTTYGVLRAGGFRLVLNIQDASNFKVLAVPAGTDAPADYASAQQGSTVEGVTLTASRGTATINITENATFDLYVIDEAGNVRDMTDVIFSSIDSEAPVLYPDYEQGVDAETGLTVITATFHPEEAEKFAEIKAISSNVPSREVTVKDADGNDVTVIRYYWIFKEDGEYSFTYQDDLGNVGTATAEVKGLSMSIDPARVLSESWYGTRKNGISHITPVNSDTVNNDVTVQLRLNKAISQVELFLYDDETADHIGEPLDATYPVSAVCAATNIDITYTGNVNSQVVVRYTASASGSKGTYILPAVNCIDKEAPVVTLTGTVVAENKQSARYTFQTSEPTILSQVLGQGYQTSHTYIATDDRAVTLNFTDRAGNQVTYRLEISELDLVRLETNYSISADGSNPTHEPAKDLALSAGSTLYVYVNKAARAVLNGQSVGDFQANTWNPMTLPNDAGIHILTLTDVNTGDVVMDAVWAKAVDRIAPELYLPSATVLAYAGDTAESLEAAVRNGVTVTDNEDPNATFTVSGVPASAAAGLYTLVYTASDAAGNRVSMQRYLYIMDGNTPILFINGEVGLPYGKVTMTVGTVNLVLQRIEGAEDQPMTIKFRKGLFTTGQMKYYAETVENMTFEVAETGHYTIYVRNQDRTEFVTYIYVEG